MPADEPEGGHSAQPRTHLLIFGLIVSPDWLTVVQALAARAAKMQQQVGRKELPLQHDCGPAARQGEDAAAGLRGSGDNTGAGAAKIHVTAVNFNVVKFDVPTDRVTEMAAAFLQSSAASLGLELSYTAVQVGRRRGAGGVWHSGWQVPQQSSIAQEKVQ